MSTTLYKNILGHLSVKTEDLLLLKLARRANSKGVVVFPLDLLAIKCAVTVKELTKLLNHLEEEGRIVRLGNRRTSRFQVVFPSSQLEQLELEKAVA